MPPRINEELCIACGQCVTICPSDVFYGTGDGDIPRVGYPGECWHCGACLLECPEEALRLEVPLAMRPPVVRAGGEAG